MCLRLVVAAAVLAAGCFSPKFESGHLKCAAGDKPCPDQFHCAIDNTCWRNGEDPTPNDLGPTTDSGPDLAGADLSITDQGPPPDLSRILDFSIPDGNHLGHVTTAAGGAIQVHSTATHSVTLSVGQKMAGKASASGSHSIQFGILRGTVSK